MYAYFVLGRVPTILSKAFTLLANALSISNLLIFSSSIFIFLSIFSSFKALLLLLWRLKRFDFVWLPTSAYWIFFLADGWREGREGRVLVETTIGGADCEILIFEVDADGWREGRVFVESPIGGADCEVLIFEDSMFIQIPCASSNLRSLACSSSLAFSRRFTCSSILDLLDFIVLLTENGEDPIRYDCDR